MPPDASLPSSPAETGSSVSGRRSTSSPASSPEFEFWRGHHHVTDDRFFQAQPIDGQLLSADELFVDGVMLPLHLLPSHHPSRTLDPAGDSSSSQNHCPPPNLLLLDQDQPSSSTAAVELPPASVISSSAPAGSSSKRWTDIFRGMAAVGTAEKKSEQEDKKRRRERPVRGGSSGSLGSAVGGGALAFGGMAAPPPELNINIWPFSRSRSSGTSGGSSARQKSAGVVGIAAAGRKVSSAPCSRSNSRGESTVAAVAVGGSSGTGVGCRRWATSPGRGVSSPGGGIHVGRASPVWQIRKGTAAAKKVPASAEVEPACRRRCKEKKSAAVEGGKSVAAGQGSCRAEEKKSSLPGADAGSHHHSFNLKALFFRKVY